MNDAVIKLRVPTEDLERWKACAEAENEGLSSWIRGKCNANGANHKDLQRPAKASVDRRRASAAKPNAGVVPTNDVVPTESVPTSVPTTKDVPTNVPTKPKRTCPHGTAKGYHRPGLKALVRS